jgi:ABC-2 type transport system ATP-binding protein
MTAPAIETLGLTKHFGDVRAVQGLDLVIEPGEVFGYLGPNGAGKTTTIRLLLDFIRPTAGVARVLGGSGADPEVRRHIGYLPGELRLDPSYTGAELFRFCAQLRGGVDEGWQASLVGRFGLDASRRIGELSTGNRRKVGIVQAFLHRPRLLVLDEPTSGLDPLLQQEFHALVREVVSTGTTVFLSSHILPEVEVLAERVGILRRGELVTVTSIADLHRQARQRIDLHVRGSAGAQPFAGIPEVVEASATDSVVHLVVEGTIEGVVKAAASLPVVRIVTHDTDLEDVFLAYYRSARRDARRSAPAGPAPVDPVVDDRDGCPGCLHRGALPDRQGAGLDRPADGRHARGVEVDVRAR